MTKRELLNEIEIRANGGVNVDALVQRLSTRGDIEELVKVANAEYRSGKPVVDDWVYDNVLIKALAMAKPGSELLGEVEPEPEGAFGKTAPLPERMLSTNKAYSIEEIAKWCDDVITVQKEYGFGEQDTFFRITPKLDGFAAYYDGSKGYTRGDGRNGGDITHAFNRGIASYQTRKTGKGEIVVTKAYFDQYLSEKYENTRNVIAAVIKEGELDREIEMAIRDGAITFQPFSTLNGWLRNKAELLNELESMWDDVKRLCIFETDGLVIEATHEDVKREMGYTNHHYRWQIAFKKNTEFHDIEVLGLQWQTAKTGRITPVVLLKPTKIGGVTVSKATGHHAGNVLANRISDSAVVRVCRSGQVIPYIDSVVSPSPKAMSAPHKCPSCGAPTQLDGDNLLCTNTVDCPAQIENTIEYFFKTIGTCDGFGPKIIEQLNAQGYSSVSAIYDMDQRAFEDCGIGSGIAANLCAELTRSEQTEIEDWRLLAAFSIPLVGRGGCERLLSHHTLEEVFLLTVDRIVEIDGFAEKTATSLVDTLHRIKGEFDALRPRFKLRQTKSLVTAQSPITGKTVVFTGTMQKGGRSDMESHAKSLGAKVGSSVSSKTDFLICGANVGASKTDAAKKHGVKVLNEDEYLAMIAA